MKNVAIIGSGIGGLTAGNLLAKKGHKVTIFESHVSPGGYTAGFRRQGFYFESGTLSFESSAQIFRVMKEIGVYDKVEFVRQTIGIIAGAMKGVCSDYGDFKSLVYGSYPAEKRRLDLYFSGADKMIRLMKGVMMPRGPAGWAAFPINLARFTALFRKYSKTTITDFAADCFGRDSALFYFFKDLGYPDMSAAAVGPALISFLEDYWTVRTGMQSWADALVDNFRNLGGTLMLGSPVNRIVTRNGAAAGVESKGAFHPADWVISAADYKKTFLEWLDDKSILPGGMEEKISGTAVSEGIVTAYLGLDMPPDELAKWLMAPHVSYRGDGANADVRKGGDDPEYFEKVSLGIYSPSLHDPRLAPAGKSSLMIQAVAPFRWMGSWGGGDRPKYRELKEKVKQTMITKASALIPGLAGRIIFSDLATPLTYERYTGNTDGATSAWSWNPNNKFYKNAWSVTVDTPVRNLLIGSCWACQIGGVPGAVGAASKCAKIIG